MAQRSTNRKPRSSGASRRGGKKSGGTPVWAWLVAGLLVGLFIAFLIYLNGVDSSGSERSQQQASSEPAKEKPAGKESKKAKEKEKAAAKEAATKQRDTASTPAKSEPVKEDKPTTPPAKAEPVVTAKATTEKKSEAESKKESGKGSDKPTLSYDFYKILPKSEVVVPEEELKKPSSSVAAVPGTYYLQVGAFRSLGEADSRKAQLAMLGIVSSIQTVTVEANSSWHRVRVGPVKDARQLERSKRQLQENNINFVTIKENN